ncbi:DedA family protein [Terrabacter sp. 2RAF25]|uniref:DedA family protein n=1 Tax=Terrabacter sp. 2RAF25 TaxID=3232998 RepID=UPI003F988127
MTVNAALLALLTPLGPFALLAIMAVAFAETGLLAGFLLPADTFVVTVGALVAAGVLQLPVWTSLAAVTVAAVAGDQVAYLVGRRLGPRLQRGRGSRLVSTERLRASRTFFERHGAKAIVLSRFVPFARTLTPVVAGVAGMSRRQFLLHNVVGAATWAAVMFGGGYVFAAIPVVADHLDVVLLLIVVVSTLPGAVSLLRPRTRRRPSPRSGVRAFDEPHGCRARAWRVLALIR